MFRRSRPGRRRTRRAAAASSSFLRHRKPLFEQLEDRRLLAITAVLNAATLDVEVSGSASADTVSMQLIDQGLATERLQITDSAGATAGAGFVQVNATVVTVLTSTVTGGDVFVNTLGGNDTLFVDSTGGLLAFANGIHFDGGAGFDKLALTQTGGPTHDSDTYSVGATNGSGTSVIVGAGAHGHSGCSSKTWSQLSTSCRPPR